MTSALAYPAGIDPYGVSRTSCCLTQNNVKRMDERKARNVYMRKRGTLAKQEYTEFF